MVKNQHLCYIWVPLGHLWVLLGRAWASLAHHLRAVLHFKHPWPLLGVHGQFLGTFIAIALSEGVPNPPPRTPPPTTAHALRQCKPSNSEHRNAMVCVCVRERIT